VSIVKQLQHSFVDPLNYMDCREYLEALYKKCKEDHSGYSYKTMAAELGLGSASNLHKMILGTRAIGPKVGKDIAEALELSDSRKKFFLALVELKNCRNADKREKILAEILQLKRRFGSRDFSQEQQLLHSEWYHFVVLELLAFPDIDQSATHLASLMRPRLRASQVTKSIKLLMNLGLVQYNPDTTRIEPVTSGVKTGAETEGLLITKYHHAIMDIAKNAISDIDEDERDISTSTFRVSRQQLEKIKTEIYNLQMRILSEEPTPEESELVYQLNFQLFPVTSSDPSD